MTEAIKIVINIDDDSMSQMEELLTAAVQRGMQKSAQLVQQVWVARAQQLDIRQTGEYIRGLTGEGSVEVIKPAGPDASGAVVGTIAVVATAPHSAIVEDGHAAFHLPSKINWSGARVKVGKNGKYMHIPFRHSAFADEATQQANGYTRATIKSMLPQDVYTAAANLKRTIKRNEGPFYDGDQFKAADAYNKGERLKRGAVQAGFTVGGDGKVRVERMPSRTVGFIRSPMGGKLTLVNPEWKSSRYEGLMKSGPKGHSQYLTIRTITPNSKGWNIPAQEGKGIGRIVARECGPEVEEIVGDEIVAALRGEG